MINNFSLVHVHQLSSSQMTARPGVETGQHDIVETHTNEHYVRALSCCCCCQMLMESLAFVHEDICIELFISQEN